MNTGKKVRLKRLFGKDGRAFIVAVDHPTFGQVQGLEKLKQLTELIIEGGVDGFIVNPGTFDKVVSDLPGTNAIITIPYDANYVKLAAKNGACAVKTSYFGKAIIDERSMNLILKIAYAAEEWGIPYILEVEVTDSNGKAVYDVESLKLLCRVGSELGADIIKASYVGPVEKYASVVNACNAPVVIRGGEKMNTEQDFIDTVKEAMRAGASGAAIGRNVWQSVDPKKTASIIWNIVHGK
ncbi:MAG: hypothetical protein QW837_08785 [Conexivisphaerales archaeon]